MSEKKGTNFVELLPELNAGVYEGQINRALSEMALHVLEHGKKGELVLKLTMTQIGEGNQVAITHAIKSTIPKKRGRLIEESAIDTPLHVGPGGKLSLFPDVKSRQMDLGAGAATGARV
jgi:hypothetical protein